MTMFSLHTRYLNGVPLPIRKFRSKERCFLVTILTSLIFIFCGTLFYLPELRPSYSQGVYRVYEHMQKAGPELLIPAPPFAEPLHSNLENPHVAHDKRKLEQKIAEAEWPRDVLQRPDIIKASSEVKTSSVYVPPEKAEQQYPVIVGGEDPDIEVRQKRNHVKKMMKHAWNGYAKYAWGLNEVRPVSKLAHNQSVFGSAPLGASIVDGLDTLYVMELYDEFNQGRDWIAQHLNVDDINMDMSVFETNIRFIGGLLSCYSLTGVVMFREKAEQIGLKLLSAFDIRTGIPYALVNFKTGNSKNYAWASGGCSILSELGTLHLEFVYLSEVTGNPVFKNKVNRIRSIMKSLEKPKGLYPNYLHPKTKKWGQQHVSIGGLGDSFYEYLLKAYIQSNKRDIEAKTMFEEAAAAMITHLYQVSPSGLHYFSDLKYDRLEYKMGALACFAGGMFGVAADTLESEKQDEYMRVASEITKTCHEAYRRSATHLAPEAFKFNNVDDAKATKSNEKYYILRPETVESYFIMWRLTKDQKYRDWAWEVVEALDKHCRAEAGYSGIKNVYQLDTAKDDVQQSYFLAEMMKYLYLIFSDDSLLSLDEWVFNSEAHPLPIKDKNQLYRPYTKDLKN